MRVCVVGAGALGSLFAAKLARSSQLQGANVVLFSRWEQCVNAVNSTGLQLEDGSKTTSTVKNVKAASSFRSVYELLEGPADIALCTVKSHATEMAANDIASILSSSGMCVTFQNGVGNAEVLASCLGADRVIVGSTSHGSLLLEAAKVRHTGVGYTVLAPLQRTALTEMTCQQISDMLSQADIETTVSSESPSTILWRKLCVNVGINAICSVLQTTNSAVFENPLCRSIVTHAVMEAVFVASKLGIPLKTVQGDSTHDSSQRRYVCGLVHVESELNRYHQLYGNTAVTFDGLEMEVLYATLATVFRVAQQTSANRCSTLQDVLRSRPTEIDRINGVIVGQAQELGVHVPVNALLVSLVHATQQTAPHRVSKPLT